MQVNILEARNQLSRLLRRAQAGEDVVIANRGEPVARLVPIVPTAAAGSGATKHAAESPQTSSAGGSLLAWLETHPLPDYLKRHAEELDTAIADERRGWE